MYRNIGSDNWIVTLDRTMDRNRRRSGLSNSMIHLYDLICVLLNSLISRCGKLDQKVDRSFGTFVLLEPMIQFVDPNL